MKKQWLSVVCLLLGIALGITGLELYLVLSDASQEHSHHPTENHGMLIPSDGSISDRELVALAYEVLGLIRSEDYDMLSTYVHPTYGLLFAPYSTINLSSNQCFTANRVSITNSDDTLYVWGVKYGTDEPIQLTAAQYFSAYVYDRDYVNAPLLGVNQIVKSANALENVSTIFPDGNFVDFCFPASAADGSGWRLLRLVFEPEGDMMKLSALIHSEYTE